jgi:hypothetical protein
LHWPVDAPSLGDCGGPEETGCYVSEAHFRFGLRFDRSAILAIEEVERVQKTGLDEVEEAPKVGEVVLDRGTGRGDAESRFDRTTINSWEDTERTPDVSRRHERDPPTSCSGPTTRIRTTTSPSAARRR